ncbi:RDD family protein [Streptomyces echinatus]|uniref:Putative RDD family membrane protein YckC n=1 Tax=Streptomyces echinatus TaxID=67293 RepID=A0A7W9PUI9_9ACTN|nr:RDD family protein [Streptomyces echinatus]MBB5928136.1 putative RDD family membrane protein YckC [Streptomyces echinatus]
MSELVTGEAVALELRPAKLPSRALAVLLDLVVTMVAYIVVILVLVASTASLDEAAQVALSIAAFLLVLVGGPIAVETLSHGRSLGKLAFGLRVVRDDGGPIRFRHALVRGAIGVVEILMTLGVVACIASLVSARGRRLGDVFAGTLVVRERIPAGRAGVVPPPPPWLAGRFAELDLSAVPDGLWLAVRQYLSRMQQLDPQVSAGMAQRFAAELAERTGASGPGDLPPAAFLAAVVHERQTREARQAFGHSGHSGPPGGGFVPPTAWPAHAPASYRYPDLYPSAAAHQPPLSHEPAGTYQSPAPYQAQPPAASAPYQPPSAWPQGAVQSAPGRDGARLPQAPVASSPEREDGSVTDRPVTGFAPPA